MTTTWLEHYQREYYTLLNPTVSSEKRGLVPGLYQRAAGFELMFSQLLAANKSSYSIVETGTLRNPGNWKDGQSARLFTEFVDAVGGKTRSVDIDPAAVATARQSLTSANFTVACDDSVTWLTNATDLDQVDLFYLDSWDVKWDNDKDSAEHHLKEFLAIESFLRPGCLVAIDDNSRFLKTGARTGKGRRIVEYLESKNVLPIYDQYQIVYKF